MVRTWVLGLLILSGFSGLAYELLWVRLLSLSLGSTTASFSVVLGVFFGGLALGSRWAGRRSLAASRPLRAYALLELLTGATGLVLYPLLKSLGPLVASVDPGAGTPGLIFRLVLSSVVLLPPTFLMGATLPFVLVGTLKHDEETGRAVSLVYGLNTVGACLGAYAVSFLMLPSLGLLGATLVTAGINFFVGGVAFWASHRPGGDGRAAEAPAVGSASSAETSSREFIAVLVATFVGGLVATGAQVVWARLMAIMLSGSAYGIGAVLVSVLMGIAAGSLLASRVMRRSTHKAWSAALFQAGVLAGLFLFAKALPLATYAAGLLPTAGLSGLALHHGDLVVVLLLLGVTTVASGACLPALVSVVEQHAARAGNTLARLYTANTAGCILGSVTGGLVLLPSIGSGATLYLMFLLLAGSLALYLVATCTDRRLHAALLGAVVLAGAASFPTIEPRFVMPRSAVSSDYFSFRKRLESAQSSALSYYEGDVATVQVLGGERSRGLSLNGLGQGTRYTVAPEVAFESVLVATIPAQHASSMKHGLVVGLGAGGTVHELLKLGVERLEVAELEKGVVAAADDIWGEQNPLHDARVELVNDDARHHLLKRAAGATRYDFITSMPAHPWVASALFTREFFELARSNLTDQGVFGTWFGPSNMPDASVEGLFGAFSATFPNWVVYFMPEAGAFYLVGSPGPLRFDPARIEAVARSGVYTGFNPESFEPTYFAARMVGHSLAGPLKTNRQNSDDNGLIEFGVQVPRKTDVVSQLTYFPVRSLTAEVIAGAEPRPLLLETLELLLGTKNGWLPVTPAIPGAADRLIEALGASPQLEMRELSAYGRIRRLAQLGKQDEATKLVPAITSPDLLARLERFSAWHTKDKAARLNALERLAPTADVLAARVSLGSTAAPAPLSLPSPTEDPLAALFVPIDTLREVPASARDELARRLVARLGAFGSSALYVACGGRFAEAGWETLGGACARQALEARRLEARLLVKEALDEGGKGNFQQALSALTKASAIDTLDGPRATLMLQTAVRLKDQAGIALARSQLVLRGYQDATLDALIAQYTRDAALSP